MRGEKLQGLNIEELQELEKTLETGLNRVMEKKVYAFLISSNFCLVEGFRQYIYIYMFAISTYL